MDEPQWLAIPIYGSEHTHVNRITLNSEQQYSAYDCVRQGHGNEAVLDMTLDEPTALLHWDSFAVIRRRLYPKLSPQYETHQTIAITTGEGTGYVLVRDANVGSPVYGRIKLH
jgi:hypothetical protein